VRSEASVLAGEAAARIRRKLTSGGITISYLARALGTSRQYAWQVLHQRTCLSLARVLEIERAVDSIVAHQAHIRSFGDRLRAARRGAGLTLKETASLIGYSWVAVERWEKGICLPKPGVLWHLASVYGLPSGWLTTGAGNSRNSFGSAPHGPDGRAPFPEGLRRGDRLSRATIAAHHDPDRKHSRLMFGQRKRS